MRLEGIPKITWVILLPTVETSSSMSQTKFLPTNETRNTEQSQYDLSFKITKFPG